MMFADAVRVFDIIVGVLDMGGVVVVAAIRWGERRMSSVLFIAALAVILISSVGTEWQAIRTPVTWRIFTNTAATVLTAVGLLLWIREVRSGRWDDTITSRYSSR